jgi:parallel beta-helix repeat protein
MKVEHCFPEIFQGILIKASHGKVTGNTLKDSAMPGIVVTSTAGLKIENNSLTLNPTTRLPNVMRQAGLKELQPVVEINCTP